MAEEVEAEAMEEDGDGEVAVSFLCWCWSVLVPVGIMCFWWKGRWHLAERMLCVALDLSADDAARFRMQRELQYDARLDEVQCALLCPPCILPCLAWRRCMPVCHCWQCWASFNSASYPAIAAFRPRCAQSRWAWTATAGGTGGCTATPASCLWRSRTGSASESSPARSSWMRWVPGWLAGWLAPGCWPLCWGLGEQAGRSAGTAVGGGQQRWIEELDVWQVGRTGSRTMVCFCCPAQHTSPPDAYRCPAYPPCPWLA